MDYSKELHHYLIGFALATLLTVAAFVIAIVSEGRFAYGGLIICAIAQLVVHLRFFLHLSFHGQQKEDLHLVLFTGFILLIMIGGTIGVLGSLYDRM